MAINKKLSLTWKGEEYSLLMTMRHIDELEQDFNLVLFAYEIDSGNCKYSKLCKLLASVLTMAGAKVTSEDIWCSIFGQGDIDPKAALDMGRAITSSCFPEVKESTKKKSAKAKAKKKTTKK